MHFTPSIVFTANIVGVIAFVLGMPVWGMLRDRFGWSRTIAASAVLNAVICVWFFRLLPTLAPNDVKLLYSFIIVGLGRRVRARHGARLDILPVPHRH